MSLSRILKSLIPFALLAVAVGVQSAEEDFLKPYSGPVVRGSDPSTMDGKVVTGYQGWFNAPGDGSGLGWVHWSPRRQGPFDPKHVTVDIWPDVSEYDDDELYETGFLYDDGSPGKVFSSHNRKTVLRHFKWMREYGIDGAFLQRFPHELKDPLLRRHRNKVLSSVREGANTNGITYTVMYDITGTKDSDIVKVFDDWMELVEKMDMGNDPAYQHLNGKPLVAIWGVGFNGEIKKRPDLYECEKLIRKFKDAGYSVMLGTPTGWREQDRDASRDPNLHKILLQADLISPWSVGRFGKLHEIEEHADLYWKGDVEWSEKKGIDYMPVVFPGFSWHNLMGAKPRSIPRLKGRFFWEQIVATKKAGANMLYLAMFDEVDEATALFKCTNLPPLGNGGVLIDYEGLPSDFYLRLSGKAGELYRGEIPISKTVPISTETSQ